MTCQEFIEFLLEYDEGILPSEVRIRFDEHLAICPDCVNYLGNYRAATLLGKRAFEEPDASLPDYVPQELVQTILALRTKVDG